MFKDILGEWQPVVYHTLRSTLEHNRLARTYIFSGPSSTPKKETTHLLAQSLVCRESSFACEVCDTCERIAHSEYADMIYLDGMSVSIKKDDILKLQHAFTETGLEKTGKKIYVPDHAENATPDALNFLLKFPEKPGSDVIAILIVEQLDRIFPTIISRCQNIPFTPLSASQCHVVVQEDLEALGAYLLSSMIHQKSEVLEVSESEDYQHVRFLMKRMLERYLSSPYDALLSLQLEGFPSKQKKHGKQAMLYLLDMLTVFFRDCLRGSHRQSDTWYQNMLKEYQKENMGTVAILQILVQMKDTLSHSVNLQLLVDQMLYRMKEVTEQISRKTGTGFQKEVRIQSGVERGIMTETLNRNGI